MPDWSAFPQDHAEQCVKCAQCLPVCPTWQLSRDESESPRGRIALMQGLARGEIEAGEEVVWHLDHCLGCRRCESICPAEVPYGDLMDSAQAALGPARRKTPLSVRLLRWSLARPALFFTVIAPLLRWSSFLPIRHPLLTPRSPSAPAPGAYPASGEAKGEVSLFMGCIARVTDGETLQAALNALRSAGFTVNIPAEQVCCGALHRHAGEVEAADQLARKNRAAFADGTTIVTCASGCAATLCDDPAIGTRVKDVSTVLAGNIPLRMVSASTSLHTPCTLSSVLGQSGGPARLLGGLRQSPERSQCCGAAGEYLLKHPETARKLRERTLDGIGEVEVICTSNPGCAMHLRAGLASRGRTTDVRHPVVEWLRHESD